MVPLGAKGQHSAINGHRKQIWPDETPHTYLRAALHAPTALSTGQNDQRDSTEWPRTLISSPRPHRRLAPSHELTHARPGLSRPISPPPGDAWVTATRFN